MLITTACRMLRIYTTQTEPSDGLITLAMCVIKVYVPMWFESKPTASVSMKAYTS